MEAATLPKPRPDGFRSARKAAIIGNYNLELQRQIKDHLWDHAQVSIPPFRKDYKEQLKEIFDFDSYDDSLYKHYDELCKFYYSLGENRIFLAQFTDKDGFQQLNKPLGQYYSKHRLDPIWNSSKSRKFRYIMANFLEKERWFEMYQPTHLVLTVPHKGGVWNGKRIYIHELIKAFRQLRDNRWWKDIIAGGLYCLEVKKNNENGYHIHLHVLCFQYPDLRVNDVREQITAAWKRIVGNESNYAGTHYGSLFVYEKDEDGNRVPHYYYELDENGKRIQDHEENAFWMTSDEDPGYDPYPEEQEIEMKKYKKNWLHEGDIIPDNAEVFYKKRYLEYGETDHETWTKGIMECLKYHFKPGVLQKEDGSYDIELIMELLEHTKGDRFMSKFGKLHNHPGLSLNGKIQTEAEEEAEIDGEVLGSAAAAERELINPFTDLPATPEDYLIIMTKPEYLLVGQDSRGRPNVRLRNKSPIVYFEPGTSVAQAFKMYAAMKFEGKRFYATTTDQLKLKGNSFWKKPDRKEAIKEVATIDKPDLDECPF